MVASKIQVLLKSLVLQPDSFTPALAKEAIREILQQNATPSQVAAFLVTLKLQQKDSDAEFVAACAAAMVEFSVNIDLSAYGNLGETLVDIVGTGGDGMNTFNVSTASGIVAAGAGCKVAKFGNRAASSQSGSADILESMECAITNVTAARAAEIINASNFVFLFAPTFHPGLAHIALTRREIGVPTIFNLLGPLVNPAQPKRLVVGVHSKYLGPLVIEALRLRGAIKAMVVHGAIGLDEISPEGQTFVWELLDSKISEYTVSPADFGLASHSINSVKGGAPKENAEILDRLLSNDYKGPILDFVLLNAAATLYIADKVKDFKEGVELARESITSGRAKEALEAFKRATQQKVG